MAATPADGAAAAPTAATAARTPLPSPKVSLPCAEMSDATAAACARLPPPRVAAATAATAAICKYSRECIVPKKRV